MFRNAIREMPEKRLPPIDTFVPRCTTSTLSHVSHAATIRSADALSFSFRYENVRSENTMPHPNVSLGPSRSRTVISGARSAFLRKRGKKSPAGPPPTTRMRMGRRSPLDVLGIRLEVRRRQPPFAVGRELHAWRVEREAVPQLARHLF